MEAIDTLAIPAVNHLNRPIKPVNKEAFIIDTYKNVNGLFLLNRGLYLVINGLVKVMRLTKKEALKKPTSVKSAVHLQ